MQITLDTPVNEIYNAIQSGTVSVQKFDHYIKVVIGKSYTRGYSEGCEDTRNLPYEGY